MTSNNITKMDRDNRRSDKFKKSKEHFLTHRNQKNKGRQTGRKITDQQHEQIQEWNDTKYYFAKNWRKVPQSELHDASEDTDFDLTKVEPNETDAIIEIIDEDTLVMAIRYDDDELNPMVLNMASCHKPGGGVASGKSAQEEQIFTRSNAHETHNQKYYPLGNTEMIYSPEVTIIKDTRENNYEILDEEHVVGMIACPALKNPKISKIEDKDTYQNEDERLIMEMKIERIFLLGIMYEHESLVLGALGCGAYNNPPEEVAKIFFNMTNKYKKYFKKIGFAILTIDPVKSQNMKIFKTVFGIE